MAEDEFPEITTVDQIPILDATDRQKLDTFSFFADGTPIIGKNELLAGLRGQKIAREACKFAIDLFVEHSPNPELTEQLADDYMYEKFGYNVQSGVNDSPLIIRNNVQKVDSDDELSVLELSPRTADQFLGIFLSELTIFPPFKPELKILSNLAIRSYAEGAFTMALYDHLLINRWLRSEDPSKDFIRYTRAAKKLLAELIGEHDFDSPDLEAVRYRLAGGMAFSRMMGALSEAEYFDGGPYEERIRSFKGKLALRAIRATQDDFFIGVASPLGEEEQRAYLATAASMAPPRSSK